MNQPDTDRRKHSRHIAREDATLYIHRDFAKLAPILNISEGGIAIQYPEGHTLPSGLVECGIYVRNEFQLENVGCKIVSNARALFSLGRNFESIFRQGIEFKDLTPAQKSKIRYFIDRFTLKERKRAGLKPAAKPNTTRL